MDKSGKIFGLALLVVVLTFAKVSFAEEMDDDDTMKSSVSVAVGLKGAALLKYAKVNFVQALNVALKAVPGNVLDGELQNEKGSLVYDFEIVDAKGNLFNVIVDAGNGKLMEAEKEGASN